MMERWRNIALWEDYVVFWRGVVRNTGRSYQLTPERRQRLEELLGDAIELEPAESWEWSWNDWDWDSLGGRHETE